MQRTVIDERYTLIEPLGSGGMAEVYLAHDEVLDRDVALKVMRDLYAKDDEFVERFRREAQSAAGLSHPNIVSIYDRGRSEDGAYYIAMEYVPRGTLKDGISRSGTLEPGDAVGVALQIADALSAAHENGVIHRDIKPQNVLVARTGDMKVTDFGIARAASSPITATNAVMGTATYMSPEQAMGKQADPRSDLYSLGVVLYEMLTGEPPYSAENPVALSMKHVHEPPRSPREAKPDVPESLDAITLKLLAKNPEDRYASAVELADDLERVRSGLPPAAGKTTQVNAPLPPLPAAPEERTKKTALRPPAAAPAGLPGPGGKRRGRLYSVLGVLILGAILLGGLALALPEVFDVSGSDGSGEESGAQEEREADSPQYPTPDSSPASDVSTGIPDASASGEYAPASGDASGGNVVPGGDVSDGVAPPPQPVPVPQQPVPQEPVPQQPVVQQPVLGLSPEQQEEIVEAARKAKEEARENRQDRNNNKKGSEKK